MRKPVISDGIHMLSGVCEETFTDEYFGWPSDGIIITIDGENYVVFSDHDDGYRSYGACHPTTKKQKFSFPEQEVSCINQKVRQFDADMGIDDNRDWLEIRNLKGELILCIGTDTSDSYYPMSIFRYYPENLPINDEILRQKRDEEIGEYVLTVENRVESEDCARVGDVLKNDKVPENWSFYDAYLACVMAYAWQNGKDIEAMKDN